MTTITKASDYTTRYANGSINKQTNPIRRLSRSDNCYNNSLSNSDMDKINLENNLKDVESTLCKLMDDPNSIDFNCYQYAFDVEKLQSISNRRYSNSTIRSCLLNENAMLGKAYHNEFVMPHKYSTPNKMKQNSVDSLHHLPLLSSSGIHSYTPTSTTQSPDANPNTTAYYYHHSPQAQHLNTSSHSSSYHNNNTSPTSIDNTHSNMQLQQKPRNRNPATYNKKSIKMSVPSSKRQILEEEFRKEKYPSNEKLQKLSSKLNMRYDEVQNYFKKRRREEKEGNVKFTNLVKLLNVYLEQEN